MDALIENKIFVLGKYFQHLIRFDGELESIAILDGFVMHGGGVSIQKIDFQLQNMLTSERQTNSAAAEFIYKFIYLHELCNMTTRQVIYSLSNTYSC